MRAHFISLFFTLCSAIFCFPPFCIAGNVQNSTVGYLDSLHLFEDLFD